MARWRIALLVALALPLLLVGLASLGWALDTRNDGGQVRRAVQLAGTDMAGMDTAKVEAVVQGLSKDLPDTEVTVEAGDTKLTTTAGDLGVRLDAPATIAAVMAEGRDDPGILGPIRWTRSLVTDRPVAVSLSVDRKAATATLRGLEGDKATHPVEPTIAANANAVTLTPGAPGRGIDIDDVLAKLPSDIGRVGRPITIRTRILTTPPTLSDDAVKPLVEKANAITESPVTVTAGESEIKLDGKALRPAFRLTMNGDAPQLTLDPATVQKALDAAAPPPFNPTGVRFDLVDGVMTPKAGTDAVVCCGQDAAGQIIAGLLAGKTEIDVDTRTITAAEGVEQAAQLGVKEVVGEFTTKHPAGQPRVKNIHRIADLTRGALIAPGQTFSVNQYVGRRTSEKGFVEAPVIEQGEFSTDVGGGVSQYATTLFNAAFFAGLDIPEHKAHSIYISRYPFGREATLAYPSVDLKIHNNTPYGVVIWPTYTSTSITIQLWSTKYATGVQSGQTSSKGRCGRVTTTRTRTFVDGHTDTQKYVASYDCNPPKHE